MLRILLPLLLVSNLALAADGEYIIGLGAALNNNDPYRAETQDECGYRGQLVDIGAIAHDVVGNGDLQVSWTYIMCSDFGTEQSVTASVIAGNRIRYGAGILLGYRQAYETWEKDYINSDSYDPLHPADRRECMMCGLVLHVGYRWQHVQAEIRYWRTDFNFYPGHNGALLIVSGRFKL